MVLHSVNNVVNMQGVSGAALREQCCQHAGVSDVLLHPVNNFVNKVVQP